LWQNLDIMPRIERVSTVYHSEKIRPQYHKKVKPNLLEEPVLWKILLLCAISYIVWSEKVSIVIGDVGGMGDARATKMSLGPSLLISKEPAPEAPVELSGTELNNVTFGIDPSFAKRNGIPAASVKTRMEKCREYVARFGPVAAAEMRRSGIPASIILAQGLLESNAGEGKLAQLTNNHFGIKCFSKRCKKGHCVNFSDDSHKDFFVQYNTIWGSFRDHSEFLSSRPRYAHLFKYGKNDYKSWARGLAQAGYATDPQYAEKLIALIQSLGLGNVF
jgi:Mannosyl-glycoprotein endo-beta-N-acetylglucosaminidase